jgi:hypothetical protein
MRWGMIPSRHRVSVLLPEPLGPSTRTVSPARMSKVRS